MTHTPTPWEIHPYFPTVIRTKDGEIHIGTVALSMTPGEGEACAAFIVRACNAHEGLVENAKGLLFFAQEYADFCKSKGTTDARLEQLIRDTTAQLAALAKAEGK